MYEDFQIHRCTFKEDKGKKVDVQSQVFNVGNFFLGKLPSVNRFQKLNFCIPLFTAKKSNLLI